MVDNGSVIIAENGDGTNNGSIVLAKRKSQATVTGTNKGYIKRACDVEEFEDESDDVFNYLILTESVTFKGNSYSGKVDYIEINTDKVNVTNAALTISGVFVNENYTMVVPVGTVITTTDTQLDGDIE